MATLQDSLADTNVLVAGTNVTISQAAAGGPVEISATGGSGGGAAGSVLAFKEATASATYTTSVGTDADVDATNLAVTFTAPASGNVKVQLEGLQDYSGTAGVEWTLRTGTTVVKTATIGKPAYSRAVATFYISGLTPGAPVTYKWGFHRFTSGTHNIYTGGAGGTNGNAMMTVAEMP